MVSNRHSGGKKRRRRAGGSNSTSVRDLGIYVGKGVAREFGSLSKNIAIEGLTLSMDCLAAVVTLGFSEPSSNNTGRGKRRRRKRI